MTSPRDEFEQRLTRALEGAAGRLEVASGQWQPPSSREPRRAPRAPRGGGAVLLVGVAVTVVVAAVALALIGAGHRSAAGPPGGGIEGPPPAAAREPHLSRDERQWSTKAWRATVARDRACRDRRGPDYGTGTPSDRLVSAFEILRHPAIPARELGMARHPGPLPGGLRGVDLYMNQVRVARSALGATFLVIPAGNVTGEENVPARCAAEQTAALRHLLSNTPKRRRQRILGAEARYLNYERFLAVHSEGLCATWIAAGMGEAPFRGELSCATPAEFQRWGVLVNANFPAPSDLRSSFWTVVPDDVATVTLSFAAGPKPHPFTITVRPVNNVVVTGEPFPRGTFPTPSAIVVRAAGGRLIKKTKNPSQRLPTDCVC